MPEQKEQMKKAQNTFSKYEIKAIRYPSVFDVNEGIIVNEENFFTIEGTHNLSRTGIERIFMEGTSFYLEYNNGKDLIVETGKKNGKTDRHRRS